MTNEQQNACFELHDKLEQLRYEREQKEQVVLSELDELACHSLRYSDAVKEIKRSRICNNIKSLNTTHDEIEATLKSINEIVYQLDTSTTLKKRTESIMRSKTAKNTLKKRAEAIMRANTTPKK